MLYENDIKNMQNNPNENMEEPYDLRSSYVTQREDEKDHNENSHKDENLKIK